MKKYLAPAIGLLAFVIGGIVARSNALDGLERVEEFFADPKKPREKTSE